MDFFILLKEVVEVVPTEAILHLHNNHNSSSELDTFAQENNKELITGYSFTIYNTASATNEKLPVRLTTSDTLPLTSGATQQHQSFKGTSNTKNYALANNKKQKSSYNTNSEKRKRRRQTKQLR